MAHTNTFSMTRKFLDGCDENHITNITIKTVLHFPSKLGIDVCMRDVGM